MRRSRTKPRQPVKTLYFPFDGGLNLVDPPLSTPDGMLLGVSNYELRVRGGYRRIGGIERFDGHDSPSEAIYYAVSFDNGSVKPNLGDVLVGQTSLAHSHLLLVQLDSGSWAGNDAAGIFVAHVHKNEFQDNENIVAGHSAFTIGFDSGFE